MVFYTKRYKYKKHHKKNTRKKGGVTYQAHVKIGSHINKKVSINTTFHNGKTIYTIQKNNGKQITINPKNIIIIDSYFDDVPIDDVYKKQLLQSLFFQLLGDKKITYYHLKQTIESYIIHEFPLEFPCKNTPQDRSWKKLGNNNKDYLKKLVQIEIGSTAYMVRTLSKCILSIDKSKKYSFEFTKPITGIWENDKDKVKLIINDMYMTSQLRLIMGFGPSAAGKTFWAQTIINLFSEIPDFPKIFLSIDGGIHRETSFVYQMIISTIKKTCIGGLTNLVTSDSSNGIFNSKITKTNIIEYLNSQNGPKISLYVPETLGDCGWKVATAFGGTKECDISYNPYIRYTGDTKWIGLHIWQHTKNCNELDKYKCAGTIASGTKRERKEGKKYGDGAYLHSIDKGDKHMKYAPGGQFKIHNTGGRTHLVDNKPTFNISKIIDYSSNSAINEFSAILKDENNQKKYNYEYTVNLMSP
jgi:hypothetical protein